MTERPCAVRHLGSAAVAGLALLVSFWGARTAGADIAADKWGAAHVWDVQRSPAVPVAGAPMTLSSFAAPYSDLSGLQVTIEDGAYVGFSYVSGTCVDPPDVAETLFNANGDVIEVLSNSGSIWGLGGDGFLYLSAARDFGSFISVGRFRANASLTYTPTTAQATCAELAAYTAGTGLGVGKWGSAQVWDVQRSPAVPAAGSPFTVSSFATPYSDMSGLQVAIEGGGYVGFSYVGGTCVDPPDVVETLYGASGDVIAVLSESGTIWGVGAEGFLYRSAASDLGTFMSDLRGYVARDSLTYTPALTQASCADVASYDPNGAPIPVCSGDCSGDGQVTVNELVQMVNNALGSVDSATCNAGDVNADGEIAINEIVAGVGRALNGCPAG